MKQASLLRRLLLSGFVLCTVIVLCGTVYELTLHMDRQKERIEEEFVNFEQGTKQIIREAVWLYDWQMVSKIIKSQTSHLISYIEICDREAAHCIQYGVENDRPYLEHRSEIFHSGTSKDSSLLIGTVHLQGHYESFLQHLVKDGPSFFMTNAISVFGIALLIFILFHRLAVRRLMEVENYTRKIDLLHVEEIDPLPLMKKGQSPDEIERLAETINGLIDKFKDEFDRRSQLEQQLTQAQKMEALGTLAGGIAHDFNNILAAILGYAQLSYRQSEPGSKLQRRLEQIIHAGIRAKDLIGQILVFSRQHNSEQEAVKLAEVVEEALGLVRASLPANIEIKADLDRNLTVIGDASRLHQVVMNLAVNAGHEMKQSGGELWISLKKSRIDEDSGQKITLAPGQYVCLEIADTGPGVPPEIQQRIFDPFFTTKETGEGTGMGLAVVHGIVQSHGGMIRLDSRDGGGAVFRIYLPETTAEQEAEDEGSSPPRGCGEHLMIVDDEVVVAEMGAETLESLGYRVSVCNDPQLALQRLKQEEVDLLISDLSMPQYSGLELAERAKTLNPDLPVLLWSGNPENLDDEAVRSGLINRIMLKPFTMESLARAIRQLLGGRNR